jgi:hypothetical protein
MILCLGVAAQGAEAACETLPESWRRCHALEPSTDEVPESPVNADALFAFGTEADVSLEVGLFLLAHAAIEEEVSNSFHIVTDHYCGLLGHRGDDSASVGTAWPRAEFRGEAVGESEIRMNQRSETAEIVMSLIADLLSDETQEIRDQRQKRARWTLISNLLSLGTTARDLRAIRNAENTKT